MADADVLYSGSLRIKKYHISFPSNFKFYKWCVTKVAHCMSHKRDARLIWVNVTHDSFPSLSI